MSGLIPETLFARAEARPRAAALRWKGRGIWQEGTWDAYAGIVRRLAAGLLARGLQPGAGVLIQGSNTPARQQVEMAVLAAGGVSLCADAEAGAVDVQTLCAALPPWAVIADTAQQASALRDMVQRQTEAPVPAWAHRSSTATLPDTTDLERAGAEALAGDAALVRTTVGGLSANDRALVLLTTGNDAAPRAVTIGHGALANSAEGLIGATTLTERDVLYSYMPTGWIGDRTIATAVHPLTGGVLAFPEESATAVADMQECGPTVLLAPPRFWRMLALQLRLRGGERGLRARVVRGVLATGEGRTSAVSRLLVSRPIRDHAGLLSTRLALCAGGLLDPETIRFYQALDLPLTDLYLLTETGGPVGLATAGTPLRALSGFQPRLDGEQIVVWAADGHSVATGDAGRQDGDGVTWLGRLSDRVYTLTGAPVDTGAVARALQSPYIRHAVVMGEGRHHVAALFDIEESAVGAWCEAQRAGLAGRQEFVRSHEVRALLEQAVDAANNGLPVPARVRAFDLLAAPLDAGAGELTRLHTVRRGRVLETRADLIDELYGASVAWERPADPDLVESH